LLGFRKKHFRFVTAICAAVSPFVFFGTSLIPWQSNSRLLRLTQELIYPLEHFRHSVSSSVGGVISGYIALVDAAAENTKLKKENFLLRTRMIDYEHQAQESTRLRQLLGFSTGQGQDITVAEVIGASNSTPFQAIRIIGGENQQLRVGMPVIAEQGVLGKILRVGARFSDVQILVDSNFNLDVMVERTRVRGVLKGLSDNRCRLLLHRRADIKIGDVVASSGMSGSFPKGVPVGTVVRISYDLDNVAQMVTVAPNVDYHRLEEVVVLHRRDPDAETIRETVGEAWMEGLVDRSDGP
jgi:rod shape-determining protein MreC